MKRKIQTWRSIAILALLLIATPATVSVDAVADRNEIALSPSNAPVTTAVADPASDWNAIAERAVATAGHPPPVAALDFAIVQVAIYDAIMALDGRYRPYHVRIPHATGSMIAAGAKAGHDILVHLFPSQASQFDADYNAYLAQHNISPSDPGVAVGAQAAAEIAELRSDDGRFPPNQQPFMGGTEPGEWRPTPSYEPGGPPSNAPGLTPWVADVQPFTFDDVDDFTPPGPPELTSARYAADLNEVKLIGSRTSPTRTAEQAQSGYFWADSGPFMWQRSMRDIASRYPSNIGDSARMFALVDLAMADAQIACWTSKYEFNFWRPLTAITLADQDGNPDTEADPNWRPLINTPNFPEYTSGHTTSSAAAAETLKKFFGTNDLEFTMTTANGLANPKTRTFFRLSDAIDDVVEARIYVGIHFRTADVHGVRLGKRIAKHVSKKFLRPRHQKDRDEKDDDDRDDRR